MSVVSISPEANKNYLGKIFTIEHLEKHKNADRLQVTSVDFQTVITGMNAKIGDVYVFFPVECKINQDFLKNTNSFREVTLNEDSTQKGFFEANCRVKAMKLRGENSCGYIVPVETIEKFCGVSNLDKFSGEYFDTINGIKMLEKYVVKKKEQGDPKVKTGKVSKKDMVVENQFYFHIDTENLRRNVFKISPEDDISISYKIHGTSFISSKVLVKTAKNKMEEFITWIGNKIPFIKGYLPRIVESEYGYVVASRRVIKSVEDHSFDGEHFYGENIWSNVGEEIREKIPNGYSIYGEIVGYTQGGSAIQGDFDYGCASKEHKVYVYRITITSPEGLVFNLSTKDCMDFCERFGLTFVPVFYIGKAKNLFEIPEESHWHEEFLKRLEEKFNEKDCFMCKNNVPEEGVVIRREANTNSFEAYKLKSFRFLEYESKKLDANEENLEDSN